MQLSFTMKICILSSLLLITTFIQASDNDSEQQLQQNNHPHKQHQQLQQQQQNQQQPLPNQQQQHKHNQQQPHKQQLHKKQHKQHKQQYKKQYKRKGKRHRNKPRTRDVGKYLYNNNNNNINNNDPLNNNNNYCELELQCKGDHGSSSLPVKLPIRGPKGPPGSPGQAGDDGLPGFPGLPGTGGAQKRVAFFAGLTDNFGPVQDNTEVVFDRVITNIGSAYSPSTGRFTAPSHGAYQFNVVVSAQGRNKAAVMVLKNGEMVATVWAESIPYWSTSSNHVVLSMDKGDQVWLILLNKASYLHGYMYTTFSGFIIFDL